MLVEEAWMPQKYGTTQGFTEPQDGKFVLEYFSKQFAIYQ